MNKLRRSFERFCIINRSKGIPNLMLYICIGNAVVYLMSQITGNVFLYNLLIFYRPAIMAGQVWRLITYPLTMYNNNILFMLISLLCYYSLGRAIESRWGTCKFNIFYFTGVILMDIYCMIFGGQATVYYLNMGLFLVFSTLYPDAGFLLFFIIPVKAWLFALFDLAIIAIGLFQDPFPVNIFPLIALGNYFLFMGKDVLNLIPLGLRMKVMKFFRISPNSSSPKVIQFRTASAPKQAPAYSHRCTVCGRTDVSNPELEFRYCSKCKGYYCYCQDHISNHAHIE